MEAHSAELRTVRAGVRVGVLGYIRSRFAAVVALVPISVLILASALGVGSGGDDPHGLGCCGISWGGCLFVYCHYMGDAGTVLPLRHGLEDSFSLRHGIWSLANCQCHSRTLKNLT